MELRKLEKEYRIHVYETGPDGSVNLHSLFNFMQDIASDHAVLLGYGRDDLMKSNHFWVLSRMYASFRECPVWNESVTVKTWPSGVEQIFAIRNYELRYTDGKFIGSASSSWLIIDRTTKKIQRPDGFLHNYNRDNLVIESPLRSPLKLIGASGQGKNSPAFRVKINDLDINLHTNNVNYIKWVTDTYDLSFVMNHRPCSAEINYLAEAIFDDEIVIRTSEDEAESRYFNHSIIRTADNKELCRVRIEWEEMTKNPI
jgi:medium-chain acyl-[acyl-carrier-protein] hydrolase